MGRVRIIWYKSELAFWKFSKVLLICLRPFLITLAALFPFLPFIAIWGVFYFPEETPHLRVSYTYRGTYSHRQYIDCQYLGVHGFVQKVFGSDCPVIVFLEKEP